MKPESSCTCFVAVMIMPRLSAVSLARAFMNTARPGYTKQIGLIERP